MIKELIGMETNTFYSFFSLSMTLADDATHRVCDFDIPFYEMNMHCETHNLYYGTGEECSAPFTVGDVVSFRNGNLRDIFIKNRTAGDNGKVVIVATVPQESVKDMLRF